MEQENILIIEDDADLSKILYDFLSKEGFTVLQARDGEAGIELAKKQKPVLILLDLMLPKVDGFEVCRSIRSHSVAPIIILSAKDSDMDKMLSLGIGADDYMTKPFSLLELVARIRSHIRRFTSFSTPQVEEKSSKVFGEIEIDSLAYKVKIHNQEIELTTREFKLLDFLASHPAQVFTKEQLLDRVWGSNEYIDMNTITVYIGRIREKMMAAGACYIKTVWGAGYKWEM